MYNIYLKEVKYVSVKGKEKGRGLLFVKILTPTQNGFSDVGR